MFKFAKKLAIAASLVAVYSSHFVAFASNNNNDEDGATRPLKRLAVAQPTQALVAANLVPTFNVYQGPVLVKPYMHLIAEHVAYQFLLENDNKSLSSLACVCKDLRMLLKFQIGTIGTRCWKAFHGMKPQDEALLETFRNMTLLYRPDPASDEGMLPLSIPKGCNPFEYTFDLSTCGDRAKCVRITTNVEEFFKVGGPNKDRVVILIHPLRSIEKRHMDKFKRVKKWQPEAPVGIFWRWGNAEDVAWFDYLTSRSFAEISSEDLLENRSAGVTRGGTTAAVRAWAIQFHVSFLNSPE
jgi:hypothetical protein